MDRGVWQATVCGVTELDTTEQLNNNSIVAITNESSNPVSFQVQLFVKNWGINDINITLVSGAQHSALIFVYTGKSVLVAQTCPTLCNSMGYRPPGSSIHTIPQARILEWLFPFPGDLPNPEIEPSSHTLQVDSLLSEPPGKPIYWKVTTIVNLVNIDHHPYLQNVFSWEEAKLEQGTICYIEVDITYFNIILMLGMD